jgi:hypothetical protein
MGNMHVLVERTAHAMTWKVKRVVTFWKLLERTIPQFVFRTECG